ncbi:Trm112 family protein [Ruania halotolerans]|uniref:Trm112 family protein n=1 Tax=Ruania halotolerans TaxID=2897773 RepID=UPI001E3D4A7E|nr:hypothetical protein [Ruania halotolerans]UFU07561.1 hypothetical protein LQF10_05520 [Ruania halotolerans]
MTDSGVSEPAIEMNLLAILRCPVTGAALRPGTMPDGGPALVSANPDRPIAYPVRSGVPLLLEHEAVMLN